MMHRSVMLGKFASAGLLVLAFAAAVTLSRRATASPPGVPLADLPPADGKYENVSVEGRVVPMVHVMNGATIVLVDTDGSKPRTWEEQFKRKGDIPVGTYNIHKTNVNGNENLRGQSRRPAGLVGDRHSRQHHGSLEPARIRRDSTSLSLGASTTGARPGVARACSSAAKTLASTVSREGSRPSQAS